MRLLWVAITASVLGLALFAYTVHQRSNDQDRIGRLSTETHTALCVFKRDLQRRRHDLWAFRESGRQIPGVTATDINRSLAAQKATLDSLAALDCS